MDGDLVLPTGGWNGWSLRIYDLATVLTKGEFVVIPKVNNVPYFTYRTLNFLEKEKMLRSNIVTEINFDI